MKNSVAEMIPLYPSVFPKKIEEILLHQYNIIDSSS